jgi:ABC-2 type transport system permease protein
MPLRFFPDWVIKVSYLMPFPHMFNTVIEIFLGVIKGTDLILAILFQMLWATGLILLSQIVLRSGIRKLIILGG